MKQARVGFIGAGTFIRACHLVTARDSAITELRAIADLDEKILQTHASNMEIGYTTTDYRKLLADPEIDIVIVGTKQDTHARFIVECLDAGKWVLCEKPMAETKEQAEAVLAAEKRNPGRLAIGFNRRFAPAYVDTKRLMQNVPRPWYINYRLMYPNPDKQAATSYYSDQARILFEGCHILDLVCWLLGTDPQRVFMTGDRLLNNCCILDFPDGSQVSFMCGSMGSYSFWKEYMEVFAKWTAISVSDFTDMRVRGISGETDRTYSPHLGEHAAEVEKWGFDFYETYKVDLMLERSDELKRQYDMDLVPVTRPTTLDFDPADYSQENPDLVAFNPDKGWFPAIEHFAKCFLDETEPDNADGKAGARSTNLALALLDSLASGQAVDFSGA